MAGKRLLSQTSDDSDTDVKGGTKGDKGSENRDAKSAHDSKDAKQNSEAETALGGVSESLASLGLSSSASPKK